MNEKIILDVYWPVIEEAIKVQSYYNGHGDGVKKICPDVTGQMIIALIKARKACPVKREEV